MGNATLGAIIDRLSREDPTRVVELGFARPHSYRGYYDELAFEPSKNVTVGSMLEAARSAVGATFAGYKGGDYVMDETTQVWLAPYGDTGETLGPMLLDLMLRASRAAPSVPREAISDPRDDGEQCGDCGHRTLLVWRAPDALWSSLTGRADGGGLLCLPCFDARARAASLCLYWECAPGAYPLACASPAPSVPREVEEALRETARRAGLPINLSLTGVPSSPKTLADAIAECVRLAIDHVTEPIAGALRLLGGADGKEG